MFGREKAMIGMIHVRALPGTPRYAQPLEQIIATAVAEARQLADAGFDALLLENMHDAPYLRGRVGPEIVAAMTAVGCAVRGVVELPLGLQILAAAGCETIAAALACGAGFVRVENFVFAHVADEGVMPAALAGPLLRYRRQIGAGGVRVLADIKKKHASHALTGDVSLAETAAAAEFAGADGVIVTGGATGQAARLEDVSAARGATGLPVFVGSGVTPQNLPALWPRASGFIVGSFLKRDGAWSNDLDGGRIDELMRTVARLRETGE